MQYSIGIKKINFSEKKRKRELKFICWYPSIGKETISLFRDHFVSRAIIEGISVPGHYPLIIISHGSGGHCFNQHYLAEYLVSHGFIVISLEHTGDCAFNRTLSDSVSNFKHRALDISSVLDFMLSISFLKQYIHPYKIGMIGHSFGAVTALLLANGRFDFQTYDGLSDNRITAFVLMGVPFSESVKTDALCRPCFLMIAEEDELLAGSDKKYISLLPSCSEFLILKSAGHFVFNMSCSPSLMQQYPDTATDRLKSREFFHPLIQEKTLRFFEKQGVCL